MRPMPRFRADASRAHATMNLTPLVDGKWGKA